MGVHTGIYRHDASPFPLTLITISHANIEKPGSHHLLPMHLLLSYRRLRLVMLYPCTPVGNGNQLQHSAYKQFLLSLVYRLHPS